tara:strand:+ start:3728 stop:3982 length:255 start_codon:yes stop_codon:yes gene_type:complete
MEKLLFPTFEIVTSIEPDIDVEEVQLAEQDVELVDDQVKVVVLFNKTDKLSALKFTVGKGLDPPPPPPPHETNTKAARKTSNLI